MKAILIPHLSPDMLLNRQLKDVHTIEKEISVEYGTILIVSDYTRKDKLDKLKKVSDEGTNNNSI